MMKKHDNLKGFSELSQAERKVFFQESDGLFDDALAKAMHTAISHHRTRSRAQYLTSMAISLTKLM